MYCITDEQIEYILNDIRRNGVETEDLQLNLLDHICCIIEQELKENDDFEPFYQLTLKRFYEKNLREIEDETINLLTFKNYYAMKKVMINSGAVAVAAFIIGSLFKSMHWPGASVLFTLGLGTFSLLFLPLMFVVKSREVKASAEKFVVGVATAVGMLFSLAILFIIMHWPGANVLLFTSIGGAAFVLLPAYFFTGIRHPERRLNTIIMSIILVGIIGLQFSLVRLRPSGSQSKMQTENYVQTQQLLQKLQGNTKMSDDAAKINGICEQLKKYVMQKTIGMPAIPADYKEINLTLNERSLGPEFDVNGSGAQLLADLRSKVNKYNGSQQILPANQAMLQTEPGMAGKTFTNLTLLASVTQLQMYLAIAENNKAAVVE